MGYSGRDNFPKAVKQELAKKVYFRCSKPGCRRLTMELRTGPEQFANLGKACHITAASVGGPRYDSSMSPAMRTSEANGIWLCAGCHDKIDCVASRYPAGKLRGWKKKTEKWAKKRYNQVKAGDKPKWKTVATPYGPVLVKKDELPGKKDRAGLKINSASQSILCSMLFPGFNDEE